MFIVFLPQKGKTNKGERKPKLVVLCELFLFPLSAKENI